MKTEHIVLGGLALGGLALALSPEARKKTKKAVGLSDNGMSLSQYAKSKKLKTGTFKNYGLKYKSIIASSYKKANSIIEDAKKKGLKLGVIGEKYSKVYIADYYDKGTK